MHGTYEKPEPEKRISVNQFDMSTHPLQLQLMPSV